MEESVVSIVATRYLEMWNEQYALVNETEIVCYGVTAAMRDIESWIDGLDPNESRDMAGCTDFTVDQLREVYSLLAPTASFFGYTVSNQHTRVT